MNRSIEEAAVAAFKRLKVSCLRNDDDATFIIPWKFGDRLCLIAFEADEEAGEAMFKVFLREVPEPRQTAMALKLVELNGTYRFVQFSIRHGFAVADLCLELAFTPNLEPAIAFGLKCFLTVVSEA